MSTPSSGYLPDPRDLGFFETPKPPEFWAGTRLETRDGRLRRLHLRNTVEACRPVALQLLDASGTPASAWHQADILDISLGGLCLLLTEVGEPLPLIQLMRLRLDVRAHPGFGVAALSAELRWFVRSGLVVSLGVGFEQPLEALPELLSCRRSARRSLDPDQTLG